MRFSLIGAVVLALTMQSCASVQKSIREPNSLVEFSADDFDFSPQVSAEARVTTLLGILTFSNAKRRSGEVDRGVPSALPVVGLLSTVSRAQSGALYNLLEANPGYDVVFYPQFTKTYKPGLLLRRETVEVKARLGKLK
jgi:hypothetical protein